MQNADPLAQHSCVAVFGLGRSGIAAARLLRLLGKRVIASDCADESRRPEFEAELAPGTELILGRNEIGDATALVTSPGLEPSLPIFAQAARRGIPVLAELELAASVAPAPIVAITGTDGKTTTTSLVAHILAASGISNALGGNIGIPLAQTVVSPDPVDRFVVETSAFQLAFCPKFHPHILIATNIAEDHSEYFKGDFGAYAATKRRMLPNMNENDWVILNASDPEVRNWRAHTKARICYYAQSCGDLPPDAKDWAYFDATDMRFCFGSETHVMPFAQTRLRGVHNAMNAMAAILAARAEGCAFDAIAESFESYRLPHHRIEFVCKRATVDFIDDSKATNPHAAIAALQAIDEPTVLIVGGVDKGLHLGLWFENMKKNVRHIMVIGALGDRFCAEAREAIPDMPLHRCASLQEAVVQGYECARRSDCSCVLLSPGCSSYDMFKSYAERGDVFSQAAQSIAAQ